MSYTKQRYYLFNGELHVELAPFNAFVADKRSVFEPYSHMQYNFRRQYQQLLVASVTLLAVFALVLGFFIGFLVRGDGQSDQRYQDTPYTHGYTVPQPPIYPQYPSRELGPPIGLSQPIR